MEPAGCHATSAQGGDHLEGRFEGHVEHSVHLQGGLYPGRVKGGQLKLVARYLHLNVPERSQHLRARDSQANLIHHPSASMLAAVLQRSQFPPVEPENQKYSQAKSLWPGLAKSMRRQ